MKVGVTQHAGRLIDIVDTLQGRNERSYQLRAMAFFILAAKFHNRTRIRVGLKSHAEPYVCLILMNRWKNSLVIQPMHSNHETSAIVCVQSIMRLISKFNYH